MINEPVLTRIRNFYIRDVNEIEMLVAVKFGSVLTKTLNVLDYPPEITVLAQALAVIRPAQLAGMTFEEFSVWSKQVWDNLESISEQAKNESQTSKSHVS